MTRRLFTFRYRSAAHFIDTFRTWYGPTLRAFESLPIDGRLELHARLADLARRWNVLDEPGSIAIPAAYLEAFAVRA